MWGVIHWTARVVAAAALVVLCLFAVGEGVGTSVKTPGELALFACVILMMAGLIVGFRHERLGGAVALGGLVLFYLADRVFSGSWPNGPAFGVLFGLPALLFLISGDHAQHALSGRLTPHAP